MQSAHMLHILGLNLTLDSLHIYICQVYLIRVLYYESEVFRKAPNMELNLSKFLQLEIDKTTCCDARGQLTLNWLDSIVLMIAALM